MKHLILLNEIRIEHDDYVLKSCLINPDYIITIQSGKLTKQGPQIIGFERERELRRIALRERESIFVDETVEELHAMISGVKPKE